MIKAPPLALIVDDAAFNRKLLASLLAVNGINSIEAENGQEALNRLNEVTPDIMLLDIMMPVMDGYQTLSIVRQKGFSFPVVIITADCQDTTKDTCLKLGASHFLVKPIKNDHIKEIVSIFIQSKVKV